MEVLDHHEVFVEEDGHLNFSYTKVIFTNGSQYFYATTDSRYRQTSEIDPLKLETVPIPSSQMWPAFPTGFTQAPEPLPPNTYVKRPSLLDYGDIHTSSATNTLLLNEARMCEILRDSPHPNIAKYLGCLVDNGRIKGLCFERYGPDLFERIKAAQPFDKESCLRSIRMGIEHLHGLGLIHCDINPSNIFSDGDNFVIGDFDSCTPEGAELGVKAGTTGWTRRDFRTAERENDLYGLTKIEEYLYH